MMIDVSLSALSGWYDLLQLAEDDHPRTMRKSTAKATRDAKLKDAMAVPQAGFVNLQ